MKQESFEQLEKALPDALQRISVLEKKIEEHKQTVETLRKSKAKFRFVLEMMNDIVWTMDLNLRTTYVSPSIFTALGYTPEERMEQDPLDQLTPESYERALTVLGEELERDGKEGVDPARTIIFEAEYYHKNGCKQWFENKISGIRDDKGLVVGLHGVSRDITTRKLAVNALIESEQRFRDLAENTSDCIWEMDAQMRTTYVNQRVFDLSGYTPAEMLGKTISEYAPGTEAPSSQQTLMELQRNPQPQRNVEWTILNKDGSIRTVETNSIPIYDAVGQWNGYRGIARDITERKQAEAELEKYRLHLEELVRERTAELEHKQRELKEVNDALKILLMQREKDKLNIEKNIASNIKVSVMPYIDKLETSCTEESQRVFLATMKSHLKEIVSPFVRKVSSEYTSLTPSEIQVAYLVKDGKSSKEIAQFLNISLNTVITHRENIRRKFGLKNKRSNLRSFMQTLE
jgi:PAS domain S-box-containing protein